MSSNSNTRKYYPVDKISINDVFLSNSIAELINVSYTIKLSEEQCNLDMERLERKMTRAYKDPIMANKADMLDAYIYDIEESQSKLKALLFKYATLHTLVDARMKSLLM